ncbi:hypothetical protein KM043_012280 [Ampulex compressa]|nr:hypothetical protein KM043_012280 [Ampulex compressa]
MQEDFIRDLRAELLGLPIKRHVKPMAVPTLYLTQSILNNGLELREHDDQESTKKETFIKLDSSSNPQNNSASYTVNAAVQTDFYKENYAELIRRIGNLESIIEQYKDIVQEYRIKNELLENSVREAAKLIEENNCPPEQRSCNKISSRRTNKIVMSNKTKFGAIKNKRLLWNSKDRIDKNPFDTVICQNISTSFITGV